MNEEAPPVIQVRDVTKVYSMGSIEVPALQGVSLEIEKGEMVAIMGPSGSGKSTLMNILGCLDQPTSGSYLLNGIEVEGLSEEELAEVRNQEIGFVFQSFNLLHRTPAVEQVELPLIYSTTDNRRERALAALEEVGLADRSHHRPTELSGGEQQRVAIARAIVSNPSIIMADEPTGNLDTRNSREIMAIFQRLNRKHGITIVFVTHESDIAAYTQRIIHVQDGLIISDEPVADPQPAGQDLADPTDPTDPSDEDPLSAGGPRLPEGLRVALRALAANKLRTALTTLGIVIGVSAVVALMSIGMGAQAAITGQIQGMGTNLLFISPGAARQDGVRQGAGTAPTLTMEDATAIAEAADVPGVVAAAPESQIMGQVVAGSQNVRTRVVGTTSDYQEVRNFRAASGDFISRQQQEARSLVAVLGSSVAKDLFGEMDPVGQSVRINQVTFQVIGVMESKGAQAMGNQDDVVFVPMSTLFQRLQNQRTAGGSRNVSTIYVQLERPEVKTSVVELIGQLLRERHRVTQDDFTVRSQEDMLQALGSVTMTLTVVLGAIAGISLVVGGIGIMNIMLVSVTERTKEIGIRKAVGAKRRHIITQFLIEASTVSILGGIVGILVGVGSSRLISGLNLGGQSLRTQASPTVLLLAFGVSAAVGLFFGIYPANRAAGLNPIEALRYE
ncbi:MAG: ABC transporter permease [Chloroflexi bacterium]|nr:ABC transporter permease [Chloroflexota bacterium]